MSVKTPTGLTERQTVKDIVLQGDTWGSILASVQVDSIGQECMEAGHFYLYKDKLPVGFLGLVDDIVGVTEVGYKAQQLNAMINLKTAEKTLQFGVSKCKAMLISKDSESVLNSDLMVDNWEVNYQDNPKTGELVLKESFVGLTKIEQVKTQTYLGFTISSSGDNMANIDMMKKKSIGVIRKIFTKLNSLHLQKYYFECSMILMNAILRPSILYACDMYYNLKEFEIRQIERIEETFLRKVLNTSKGCPIVQLYLEMGHTPARVEIQKARCLWLQYILQQTEDSTVYKMFKLQQEMPTRGDWVSSCMKDLEELQIENTLEEIRQMTKYKFTKILRKKTKDRALNYLQNKQGSKGKEIIYSKIEMSEYLSPLNEELTFEEKRRLFEIRNKMVNIPSNFPKSESIDKCVCGEILKMEHSYECKVINNEENETPYEKIYTGNLSDQIKVFRNMEKSLANREKYANLINDTPCDPPGSAAFCSTG